MIIPPNWKKSCNLDAILQKNILDFTKILRMPHKCSRTDCRNRNETTKKQNKEKKKQQKEASDENAKTSCYYFNKIFVALLPTEM